jgi:signal peptidase I
MPTPSSVANSSGSDDQNHGSWWRRPNVPAPLGWPLALCFFALLAPGVAGAIVRWPEGLIYLLMLPGVALVIWRQQLAARELGIVSWQQMPPLRMRLIASILVAPGLLLASLAPRSTSPLVLALWATTAGEASWRMMWRLHSRKNTHDAFGAPTAPPKALPRVQPITRAPTPLVACALGALLVLVFLVSFGMPALSLILLTAVAPYVLRRRRGYRSRALDVVMWVGIGLFVGRLLLPGFALRTVAIRSAAMEPSIAPHQRVLFNRTGIGGIGIGDIVAFHAPTNAHRRFCGPSLRRISPGGAACALVAREHIRGYYIRRVVGGPGDVISIVGGRVIRNGRLEHDAYLRSCIRLPQCNFPSAIRIPQDTWFLLADNRRETDDSRFFGPIPRGWIIGVAIMRTWPISRVGFL